MEITTTCRVCGTQFTYDRQMGPPRLICSSACKREARRASERARNAVRRAENMETTAECRQCGEKFTYDRRGTARVFCSSACKTAGRTRVARERHRIVRSTPRGKVDICIGNAIRESIGRAKDGSPWEKLLGYTARDLVSHLEAQFVDGMTWENHGVSGWHIDHIIPKSWFSYTAPTDKEFVECWSMRNLQPMWASDNLSKGNRFAGRAAHDCTRL